ncbi:metal ABC transporter solute-binding protein, Zn/Mn family [Corynebacterium gerontici]|uniref:Manganese ABC transporter substrate-binding lipoprotein n=1 Tax=Corynebacterium gerontici TaxID=2079234 RepID=A0A3G6IYW7_9CORY|nr:zinc ABC transporter substrate-binding protein [Corynebacterium gerontici]AZA10693.1 Manganese ABC transporter substrate-binding lipoprotein precursor [Corynebacterium gerontici]
MRHAPLILCAITACSLVACSSESAQQDENNANAIRVATSTNVWSGIVEKLSDDPNVQVSSVIEAGAVDPHTFEPSAADMAKLKEADVVVVGGGGYDAWAYQGIDHDKVVAALPIDAESEESHDHDHHDHHDHHHGDVNEHVWFDIHAVQHLAEHVTEKLQQAGANTNEAEFMDQLEQAHQKIHDLPKLKVAQTEPIADYLLETAGMDERTPKGYREATLEENEPSASDVAAFLEVIKNKDIDVLIYNPQTETDMTKQLRKAAEEQNIPVVEIRETPPEGQDYLSFLNQAINDLASVQKR